MFSVLLIITSVVPQLVDWPTAFNYSFKLACLEDAHTQTHTHIHLGFNPLLTLVNNPMSRTHYLHSLIVFLCL